MSNAKEAIKIHSPSYQDSLAKGIAMGVLRYKKALSKGQ